MFHSLSHIELILPSIPAFVGLIFLYLNYTNPQQDYKTIAYIFLGLGVVFLMAGIVTPPDIISTLILSIPASIIFLFFSIKRHKK